MLRARFQSEESSMNSVSTAFELPAQGAPANHQERHPLTSFRPLALLLSVFWLLVIASFVSLRL